jgi:imidazolonepropionase-like amidohydrolase
MTRTVLEGGLGMDAAAVWRACTSDAARLLDRADLGLLVTGRRADVVAFEGDAGSLDDLAPRIQHAWKDGVAVR